MKNRRVPILSIITNIILIAILCSFIRINGSIIKEKQIIKEMSESTQVTDLNNQINALNTEHTEYMNYIQTCKAQLASAITDMGVETSEDASLDTMASNIRSISGASTISAIEILDPEQLFKSAWNDTATKNGTYGTMTCGENTATFIATKNCTIKACFSFTAQVFGSSYINLSGGCVLIKKLYDQNQKKEYIIKVPEGESVSMYAYGINYSSYSMGIFFTSVYDW